MTATGLQLAGLREVRIIEKGDESKVPDVLMGLIDSADIILITTSLMSHAQREIQKLRKANKMIVEIPDRTGPGEDFIDKMIKEVIGFELKK